MTTQKSGRASQAVTGKAPKKGAKTGGGTRGKDWDVEVSIEVSRGPRGAALLTEREREWRMARGERASSLV